MFENLELQLGAELSPVRGVMIRCTDETCYLSDCATSSPARMNLRVCANMEYVWLSVKHDW